MVLEETLGQQRDQTSQKEINPEYSLEGLMLKLKLRYFGHLMENALMLGKIDGKRKRAKEGKMVGRRH